MNIGELFLNLGIKGTDKTVGALSSVNKTMGDVKSTSIEAKAAIIGSIYALEQLFAASGRVGTDLTNFSARTGQSTQALQRWQEQMRMAGGTAEEMEGIVNNLISSMAAVDIGGANAPAGLKTLAQASGKEGIDFKRKFEYEYMLGKIRDGVKNMGPNPQNKAVAEYLAKTLGFTPNLVAGIQKGLFDPAALAKTHTPYSDKFLESLNKSHQGFTRVGIDAERTVARFNARHGSELAAGADKIILSLGHLAEAIDGVVTKFHLFDGLAILIQKFSDSLKLITEVTDSFGGKEAKPGDITYLPPDVKKSLGLSGNPIVDFLRVQLGIYDTNYRNKFGAAYAPRDKMVPPPKSIPSGVPSAKDHLAPKIPAGTHSQNGPINNTVNQNLNFAHDGKEIVATTGSLVKATQDAFRQFNLGQVS